MLEHCIVSFCIFFEVAFKILFFRSMMLVFCVCKRTYPCTGLSAHVKRALFERCWTQSQTRAYSIRSPLSMYLCGFEEIFHNVSKAMWQNACFGYTVCTPAMYKMQYFVFHWKAIMKTVWTIMLDASDTCAKNPFLNGSGGFDLAQIGQFVTDFCNTFSRPVCHSPLLGRRSTIYGNRACKD